MHYKNVLLEETKERERKSLELANAVFSVGDGWRCCYAVFLASGVAGDGGDAMVVMTMAMIYLDHLYHQDNKHQVE